MLIGTTHAALAACGSGGGSSGGSGAVTYEVTGAADVDTITYTTTEGETKDVAGPTLPWHADAHAPKMAVVLLKARSKTMDPVTCKITVNGKVADTKTDSIASCTATVS